MRRASNVSCDSASQPCALTVNNPQGASTAHACLPGKKSCERSTLGRRRPGRGESLFARAMKLAALMVVAAGCESKQEPPEQQAEAPAPAPAPAAPVSDKVLIGHVASMTGAEATFG